MKTLVVLVATATWFASVPAIDPVLPPGGQDWEIDGVHSSVVFKVKHANLSWFHGTFNDVSGTLTLDDAVDNCKVSVKIAAASIETRDGKRNEHLKGPDFFDAKQFADITFTGSKFKKAGDGYVVDGELVLHGVRKPLTIKVAKTGEGEFQGRRMGFETMLVIKRSDFGMTYGVAEKTLGDEVMVTVALEVKLPAKGK